MIDTKTLLTVGHESTQAASDAAWILYRAVLSVLDRQGRITRDFESVRKALAVFEGLVEQEAE
jgi:hypothetical protein